MVIAQENAECNLICSHTHCKATAKVKLDKKFIKKIANYTHIGNGRFRAKYFIDYNDPNLRLLENWTVLSHISNFPHADCPNVDFYIQFQADFRETNFSGFQKFIYFRI